MRDLWMIGLPCTNCGSEEMHTLKCCNVCEHRRPATDKEKVQAVEGLTEALTSLDSITSLILHRHRVDPPLSFDEDRRLRDAIGVLRKVL